MSLYKDVSLPVEGIHKFSGNIAQFMPLKHTHVSVFFVRTWQVFAGVFCIIAECRGKSLPIGWTTGGGGWGACDGRVTGTIQFTIPSDPVGSKVVPEVEDFESDSERVAADIAVSDWL